MDDVEQYEDALQFREPRLITINNVKGAQNNVSISRPNFCWWYWINGELAIAPLSVAAVVRVVSFAY